MMERLTVFLTNKGRYSVRPIGWAGIWDKYGRIQESGFNHIGIFSEKKDAEFFVKMKNLEVGRKDDRVMKRRTGRNPDGDTYFENCFYEPCNGEGASERCNKCDFLLSVCEDLAHYEELEELLRKAFGDCDGLLDEMVNSFVKHANDDLEELKNSRRVRLLTDDTADKWLRWKELEKDGKLLEIPCKVGDTVYVLVEMNDEGKYTRIKNDVVKSIYIDKNNVMMIEFERIWHDQPASCFGKDIFLDYEKAKEALEGMKK